LFFFRNREKRSYSQENKDSKVTNVVGNLPLNPDQKVIDPATKELIDRLLLERLSEAGIARALKVSEQWLQDYVNRKYAQVPRTVKVSLKKGKLTIQCDELWSFVVRFV
jgi:AraC-like DNA-binding protein